MRRARPLAQTARRQGMMQHGSNDIFSLNSHLSNVARVCVLIARRDHAWFTVFISLELAVPSFFNLQDERRDCEWYRN